MRPEDLSQVKAIIGNLDRANKKVPYFHDLRAHPVYGQFFRDMQSEDVAEIKQLINMYIKEKIEGLKTKWWELFRRFYVINQDTFRKFRELNADVSQTDSNEFQSTGKIVEEQLFKFENILTQNMMKKPQGLDKTVTAYYDIAYSFFPLYNSIG